VASKARDATAVDATAAAAAVTGAIARGASSAIGSARISLGAGGEEVSRSTAGGGTGCRGSSEPATPTGFGLSAARATPAAVAG
jgi:hypothetical protein